jgi:hypothetical protein
MTSDTLFPLIAVKDGEDVERRARVRRPNWAQLALRPVDLEALLPADHRARLVGEFVEGLDLEPLYAEIRAVEGTLGDPRSTLRFRWRSGCTRRWKVWAVPVPGSGCASSTTLTA